MRECCLGDCGRGAGSTFERSSATMDTVTMESDSIPLLEVNALSNEVFLAINKIRHLWRQRADTNSIFKEITKIEQYQSITKDFLQDHIDKLIIDEKIINKINRDKNSIQSKYRIGR